MMSEDCIFCKIIRGEVPSYKIYEDDYTYAFLDISKDVIGHTLVIPKKHCINMIDADLDTYLHVQETVQKISKHYVNKAGFDGINIMNANNVEAQQSVFHYHVHIIPRKKDDGLNAWPFDKKQEMDMANIANNLKIN